MSFCIANLLIIDNRVIGNLIMEFLSGYVFVICFLLLIITFLANNPFSEPLYFLLINSLLILIT